MFTISIWQEIAFSEDWFDDGFDEYPILGIFASLLISIFTLPIDLILLPIELIAFIIYKIVNKEV